MNLARWLVVITREMTPWVSASGACDLDRCSYLNLLLSGRHTGDTGEGEGDPAEALMGTC